MTYVEGEAPWSEDEQFAERAKACKARVKIFGECGGEGDFEGQCDECNYDAMELLEAKYASLAAAIRAAGEK
jgi:hypothetical protein